MSTILTLLALVVLSFYFPVAAAVIFGGLVILNIVVFIAAAIFTNDLVSGLKE